MKVTHDPASNPRVTHLEALVLSFFDSLKGPTITHVFTLGIASTPTKLPPNVHKEIENLMDTQITQGFFTYGFETYTSANVVFEIPSNLARGNRESLCLSIVTHTGKPELFKETLLEGAQRLKAIPHMYKAFHVEPKAQDQEVRQKRQELEEFLAQLCQDARRAREKVVLQESDNERKRSRTRDRKRDRDRDEARDYDRDETRDRDRDEARDYDRDKTRDRDRDETRDHDRDENRDRDRD